MRRAIHQSFDSDPKIFVDPVACLIVDRESEAYAQEVAARNEPLARLLRSAQVLRSRYTEDCLADAVAQRGITQYLIFGAGLDTFAFRQPPWARSLRIYEVDHPATQKWKRDRLLAADLVSPANLTFAPADFERMTLSAGLNKTGFDFSAKTFCSWLGVTMYLTEEAIDKTFEFASHLRAGSEIVFSYLLAAEALAPKAEKNVALTEARTAALGEPIISRFLTPELQRKLGRIGFSRVVEFTPDEAHKRYFEGRCDGLAAPQEERLMRAIV